MKEKLNSNDNKIYRSVKIRLLPTKEQEILFWKSVGVARWSYNYFLSESYRVYQEWLEDNSKPKHISELEVRKYINNVLKKTTHTWLKEVGSNVMKQGVKDANIALQNFFKHGKGYPKFKSKKRSKPSFYVNYESLRRTQNGFHGEKIGVVKTRESLPKICKNIQKQNSIIQRLYNRLLNIRTNYLHQTTTEIVKTKPFQIVLEDLNVSGMMKNRHLSRSIMIQKLYEFRRQIEYKAELYGIEVLIADRFYSSSKTCSCCGNVKKDLKLSDRVYRCDCCGNIIDRDINASINLANYNIE